MLVVGLLGFRLRQWVQQTTVAVQMFLTHLLRACLISLACLHHDYIVFRLNLKKMVGMVRSVFGNHERMELEHWGVG
jgi:hypothetical protein